MGQSINQTSFSEAEATAFANALQSNLQALQHVLATPNFGSGPASIGAELELYLIDHQGHPLPIGQGVVNEHPDPQLTLELNRYNLEYNLSPVLAKGRPFSAIEQEINQKLSELNKTLNKRQGVALPIGILPTLDRSNFGPHIMTDLPRYHALENALKKLHQGPFEIDINGEEKLRVKTNDVTFEGANTSFQIHYRVLPEQFADSYNAVQLTTPLVVGCAANSPIFLEKKLWHETRVALFKQSIDCRPKEIVHWHLPARVNFGSGWVREGAYELFAEAVHLYTAILPVTSNEDPLAKVASGEVPALEELRMQQGSIWYWNRPVYDDHDGGHLRIEMRALPAGPTSRDMLANAALAIGLSEGIKPQVKKMLTHLPFQYAVYNFYRSAQFGLNAKLIWPDIESQTLTELPLAKILQSLLPTAERGLQNIGIEPDEIKSYLAPIKARLENHTNGALWQLKTLAELEQGLSRHDALHKMLERYMAEQTSGRIVAEWR